MIEFKNINKFFNDKKILDNVSLKIQPNEIYGLLGPNGAGKTTLIMILLGRVFSSNGDVFFDNCKLNSKNKSVLSQFGVVSQFDNLDPDFTVVENLRVYSSYFKMKKNLIEKRVEDVLEFVLLEERKNERIENLSGGMKRRLSIARALLNDPKVLILDEPTTGLDPQTRQIIWNKLKALKKNGTTILLTTHFMEEAEKLCDNISIIDSGEIKLSGNPQSLISENLPKYILETTNVETINFLEKNSQHYDRKIENYTNTYFLNDLVVTNDLKDMQGTIIRPSNLEDLFLHITGHQLRE
jgi:lipooligosaccharide transport system ATP-binding protein